MQKKLAIISGAGTGIGAACAEVFGQQGFFVLLLGRKIENLKAVSKKIEASEVLECDVTNEKEIRKVKTFLEQNAIQNISLVNNAGIFRKHSFLEEHLGHWKEQFETNVFGAVRLTQTVLPFMIQQKRGSIVNISSTLALRTIAQVSAYSASKAAMNSWTQSLALEVASFGIRVNCICPGLVDTPIHDFHKLKGAEKEKALQSMAHIQPLGRVGIPSEIAEAVYFLSSDKSAWTTGAILPIDGGVNLT